MKEFRDTVVDYAVFFLWTPASLIFGLAALILMIVAGIILFIICELNDALYQ